MAPWTETDDRGSFYMTDTWGEAVASWNEGQQEPLPTNSVAMTEDPWLATTAMSTS
jgi:hypothetical protein